MKNIKNELLKRFEFDQKFSGKDAVMSKKIYCENTVWLKSLIAKIGWPSQELVGITGEQSAWLITQHSLDIRFQEKCLGLINVLPLTKERKEYIAYLTDSILVKKERKQIYGTQFFNGEPFPIEDEINLDKRREESGLSSFIAYKKQMQNI